MDVWATALIAGSTAIAASALTGYISWRIGQTDREDRRSAELAAAIAGFGHALDRLDFEVRHMPPPLGRAAAWTNQVTERRFPHFDWLLGFLSLRLFGRRTLQAIDVFIAAINRLILVAPEELLNEIEAANELLSRAAPRDEGWRAEWTEMRGRLLRASRAAAGAPDLSPASES